MKVDPTMLLLLVGGGLGIYFLSKRGVSGGGGATQGDLAMMQHLAQMQAAASANQEAMMKIIQDARNKEPSSNPWNSPDVLFGLGQLGIQIAGLFDDPDPTSITYGPGGMTEIKY